MTDDLQRTGAHELLSHQVRGSHDPPPNPPPLRDVSTLLVQLEELANGASFVEPVHHFFKGHVHTFKLHAQRRYGDWFALSVTLDDTYLMGVVEAGSPQTALLALRTLLLANKGVPYLATLALVGKLATLSACPPVEPRRKPSKSSAPPTAMGPPAFTSTQKRAR